MLDYLYGFVAAGTDTTGASLANALVFLAESDLLGYAADISGDADAMRNLVEEILRFGTPLPMKPLFARKNSRFGDLEVPAGSTVAIWFAAANRDDAVNGSAQQSDPNTFDPLRWPNRHLALGWGKHHCLGAELARLETRTVLTEVARRLPGLQMNTNKPFRRTAGIVDSVAEAHFTFDQARAERFAEERTAG